MLNDSLTKAFGKAERFVALARKQTGISLPGVLSRTEGSNDNLYQSQNQIVNAEQQFEHNRGWVYAAVRLIAQRVAKQRIHVAREVKQRELTDFQMKSLSCLPLRMKSMADRLEPLDDHPILALLADPWELSVAWSMIAVTVTSLELTGRALWYVTKADNESSRPQIFPIPVSWIEEVDRRRTTWKVRIPGNSRPIDIPGDHVVYFYYPDPANPWGALSPLRAIAGAVHADESITQAQWRIFEQGQFPGVVITAGRLPPATGQTEGPRVELTAEQRQQLINAVRTRYSGVHKTGEPLILDSLIEKVEKFSLAPDEMDFLNSAKSTKAKILQGFGVSPILLGEVEGANRASATVADKNFVDSKINPLIELMSQTLTMWLAPMFAANGEKLTVWIEEAVADDAEMTSRNWSVALTKGACTVNEYRRHVLNLPDIEGGDVPLTAQVAADPPAEMKALIGRLNPYTLKRIGNE